MDTKSAISKACEIVGGISSMARLVGVKPPTVHQWVTADRPIPAERCPDIERATNGAVTCEELRPDLADQWQYLRASRSPAGKPRPLHRYTQGANTVRQTAEPALTAEQVARMERARGLV